MSLFFECLKCVALLYVVVIVCVPFSIFAFGRYIYELTHTTSIHNQEYFSAKVTCAYNKNREGNPIIRGIEILWLCRLLSYPYCTKAMTSQYSFIPYEVRIAPTPHWHFPCEVNVSHADAKQDIRIKVPRLYIYSGI